MDRIMRKQTRQWRTLTPRVNGKGEENIEFERFYEEHLDEVRAYCLRRADTALAEDAVSQTFEIAWRRRAEVRRPSRGWLLGIARRVLANRRRADRRQQDVAARLVQEASLESEQVADAKPILEALARLSQPDQEALMLAAWDGLGSGEAAQVLGCSPVAFRLRLHRARRRLGNELGQLERRPSAILDADGMFLRMGETRS
jgi:RNA polymerase sigma-70 factor, ECF subfamily